MCTIRLAAPRLRMDLNRIVSPASADTTVPSPDAPIPLTPAQRVDFNWSDVKGVYKNCRGIWAAQWTDERGQRHTKYFNPKFYASEAVGWYLKLSLDLSFRLPNLKLINSRCTFRERLSSKEEYRSEEAVSTQVS
eukprot:Blabericola_migrator_1__700@NODE_1174_length_5213_cov_40_985037_g798_i0_p6_GENE_NODE_1174_length_5213_cov_40_985037_g798_i0NODE_1174_length_5213_cov_40_985037_g798_i0_p6_ORF_typecomplete_len135_score10_16AP2/PF00847_20/0_00011_NODE_1174_length_5213_cov_40_985037_g798_i023522756